MTGPVWMALPPNHALHGASAAGEHRAGRHADRRSLRRTCFGNGPTNPMLPGSWSPDDPSAPEGGRHD